MDRKKQRGMARADTMGFAQFNLFAAYQTPSRDHAREVIHSIYSRQASRFRRRDNGQSINGGKELTVKPVCSPILGESRPHKNQL